MGRRENSPLTRHVGNPVVKVPPGEKGALTSGNGWGGLDSNQRPTDYESADPTFATSGNRRERASDLQFCSRSRWVISGRFPCTRGPNAAPAWLGWNPALARGEPHSVSSPERRPDRSVVSARRRNPGWPTRAAGSTRDSNPPTEAARRRTARPSRPPEWPSGSGFLLFSPLLGHGDHDVPLLVPLVDVPVSLGHLFQGIAPIDDGLQVSYFDQLLEQNQVFGRVLGPPLIHDTYLPSGARTFLQSGL